MEGSPRAPVWPAWRAAHTRADRRTERLRGAWAHKRADRRAAASKPETNAYFGLAKSTGPRVRSTGPSKAGGRPAGRAQRGAAVRESACECGLACTPFAKSRVATFRTVLRENVTLFLTRSAHCTLQTVVRAPLRVRCVRARRHFAARRACASE